MAYQSSARAPPNPPAAGRDPTAWQEANRTLLDAALSLCGCRGTGSVDLKQPQPRVWLFDEVSGISGLTRVFKAARDNTLFGDDTMVATGSRWVSQEDIQANLLAGRAGRSERRRLRQLLPMGFRDFAAATRPELALPQRCHPARLMDSAVAEDLQALAYGVDDYDLAWQDYLGCGGVPRAVAEYHARVPSVGPINVTYWPGCGRMSIPMPHWNRCPSC